MLTKTDVLFLLKELENKGVDTKDDAIKVMQSSTIQIDILKKINDTKPLDVLNFYEKLRKSYNKKKSKLYINIMKADENSLEDPKTIMTTLSALLNQILQFEAEDKPLFYKHARADEIVKVLNVYFINYNLEPAKALLKLYKADLKVMEMLIQV